MGIREKYPFPSEEDYRYQTEGDAGNFFIRIGQAIGIIGVLVIVGTLIFGIFLNPETALNSSDGYYEQYAPLLLFIALGAVVFFVALILNLILMPWSFLKKNKKPKDWLGKVPVECGETDVKGAGMIQFGFQYYPFALVYIVFDVVGVFLMLWALMYGVASDPLLYLVAIILFLLGPLASLFYWLKKEKIKWS
ncbi:MAG: NADH-quinone oxidoreductase subunit A [Candidatus Hodarchaeales archaeon]|jgi:NADH-quinone oxidoreductase subunit A